MLITFEAPQYAIVELLRCRFDGGGRELRRLNAELSRHATHKHLCAGCRPRKAWHLKAVGHLFHGFLLPSYNRIGPTRQPRSGNLTAEPILAFVVFVRVEAKAVSDGQRPTRRATTRRRHWVGFFVRGFKPK
mmetsp:Transcript_8713/g.24789  ORF Transcript_8713/g.24789 Transcript_8713/m.24789 type:complete len:132 (+) Transcript_8713:364-759(+)